MNGLEQTIVIFYSIKCDIKRTLAKLEVAIKRHRQHWTQNIERRQTNKTTTRTPPNQNEGERGVREGQAVSRFTSNLKHLYFFRKRKTAYDDRT